MSTTTQPPKTMRYDSQAIVVLADDLAENATVLQNKREAAGDLRNAFSLELPKSRIFRLAQITPLPREYRQPTSRLIILGHGDANSSVIATATTGGRTWNAEQFAREVRTWLVPSGIVARRLQRISLHMCYGGGNRGNAPVAGSSSGAGFRVSPFDSFAYEFARRTGEITVDVTARTEETRMESRTRTTTVGTERTTSFSAQRVVGGRHHEEGDKFQFTTVPGSSCEHPADPSSVAGVWRRQA